MKYYDTRNLNIAYIGGGSRGWARTLMTDLAKDGDISGTVRLYDINKETALKNEIIGNHLSNRSDVKGKWKYEVKDSLEDALTGADFIIISILPKTFDEMEVDVHMPERLGIYQSVGDTAGPGGMIRALRTIPMFVEIAEAVKEYCPEAWVINYTNPMSLCVKTLYRVFPEIHAFGCCHEVFGTQKMLAAIVEKELGVKDVKKDDINVNVVGINHFTWFTQASYKSLDLFPLYRDFVEKNYDEGFEYGENSWMNSHFACANRVKFDLFKNYGAIAAAGDRHLAEFMPGDLYLKDPETVKGWKFSLTPVSWRKKDLLEKLEKAEKLANFEEEIDLSVETGEEGVALIKAICGLGRVISNVNIPNFAYQIPNLPKTAVVETNAVFELGTIRPVYAGEIPEDIKILTMPHIQNHERILSVAMEKYINKDVVCEAFANDPLIKGRASEEDIRQLVDDMIKATLS